MSDWLERELRRELAPVEAPDGLWQQVNQRRSADRHRFLRVWPVAAILTAAVAIGTLWMVAKGEQPPTHQLALENSRDRNPATCLSCHTSI
jgi:hypothetical protein